MKIKIGSGLLPLAVLVIVLIITITFFPSNVMRIILGVPFVLFCPGYVLMLVLFPGRRDIGDIERVALSFGISISIVPLIGLILNYTPWGIRLESILYSLAAFIFSMSALAWARQKKLTEEERFGIQLQLAKPGWEGGVGNKAIFIILLLAIIGALGALGYVIATPRVEQKFTQFYILGPEGKATAYPDELNAGEEGRVVVGIINDEHETVSYEVEVRIDNVWNNEAKGITLEAGEKWENEVNFIPRVAGENQKVEFLLYKNGEVTPFLEPLHLWIDVSE